MVNSQSGIGHGAWGSKKSDKTGQPSSEVVVGCRGSIKQGCPVLSSFSVGAWGQGGIGTRRQGDKEELPLPNDGRCFKPGNPSNAQPNLCPMPNDGRCFKPGNPSNAQPNLCPMPNN
ncbi:hypothetical protein PI95_028435 [Hassallia byssoidea VB512170]|uniref:Uncharacterized protein n=1 Tax=Hassallia byssoidea VB512170 TaxID=1304833 RepID=A0A846HG59_9CYAN|nr:hypothetical protein [Hassalia byssoidea]NEU76342.1 hypothetical protein [Hassalia byssoidea VB512170]